MKFLAGILGARRPSIEFLGTDNSTTNASAYTFSSKSLGTADGSRYIAVAVHFERGGLGNSARPTVTVNGVTATYAIEIGVGTPTYCAIFIAAVPTGETGDIVVTMAAGAFCCAIGWWKLLHLSNAAPATTNASTSSPGDVSVDVQNHDLIIAASTNNSTGLRTFAGVSEQYDTSGIDAGIMSFGGGDAQASAGATPLTVTVTYAGGTRRAAVAAVWR